MFELSEADLSGRVLDCPGGGSSFTAVASAAGTAAVAVDPVYAESPQDLADRVRAEVERGAIWTGLTRDRYVWDFYASPERHTAIRVASAKLFAADLLAHPERYRVGALPELPFEDRSFDLVLSSHFLFTYADRLDYAFHLASLLELARVAGHEARVFPLLHLAGHSNATMLDTLRGDLDRAGIRAVVRPTGFEFQRGATEMLVLDRRR